VFHDGIIRNDTTKLTKDTKYFCLRALRDLSLLRGEVRDSWNVVAISYCADDAHPRGTRHADPEKARVRAHGPAVNMSSRRITCEDLPEAAEVVGKRCHIRSKLFSISVASGATSRRPCGRWSSTPSPEFVQNVLIFSYVSGNGLHAA